MTVKILVLGADDRPGGVAGYVNLLVDFGDSRKFEFHCAVSAITESSKTYLHPAIIRHSIPQTYTIWSLPVRALTVRKLLRSEGIRLLHLHTARAGLLGCIASLGLDVRTVYTGHSWRFEQKDSWIARFAFRLCEAFICHCADMVTFLTRRDRALGISRRLVRCEKSVVINTRICAEALKKENVSIRRKARQTMGLPADSWVVGNMGYLSERKDPITFLLAARKIATELPDTHFLWVGDGDLRHLVEELAYELNLTSRLTITGFVPPNQVRSYLELMDVLLFTSKVEGIPLTVLEAQLCSIPVVSSAYLGSDELVSHGVTGYSFPLGDAGRAAEMVIKLLNNPGIRDGLAKEALAFTTRHHADPRKMVCEYEHVYLRSLSLTA